MTRKIIILALMATLASSMATATILDFSVANVAKVKDVRRSLDNPITLYKRLTGTPANGQDTFFIAQTLQNLNPGSPMSPYDTKVLHKLICGSNVLQGAPTTQDYGYLGFYMNGTKIVGVPAIPHDLFNRLDNVLKQIGESDQIPATHKAWAVKYYLTAMARVISTMHAQNIMLNNVGLDNFYVKAGGGVVPADLSELSFTVDVAAKNSDWKKFAVDTMPKVFRAIYPMSVDDGEFIAFAVTNAAAGLGGVRLNNPALTDGLGGATATANNWSTFNWTKNHVINALEMNMDVGYDAANPWEAGLGGIGAAAAAPGNGDAVDFRFTVNADNYLTRAQNLPAPDMHANKMMSAWPLAALFTRAQHINTPNSVGGGNVHLPDAIRDLMRTNLGAPAADTAGLCAITSWQQ